MRRKGGRIAQGLPCLDEQDQFAETLDLGGQFHLGVKIGGVVTPEEETVVIQGLTYVMR